MIPKYNSILQMRVLLLLCLLSQIVRAFSLVCYNCTATQSEPMGCARFFFDTIVPNATKEILVNCDGENSMCFLRSWAARASNAWIVQRGCYRPGIGDSLIKTLNNPNTGLHCLQRRLAVAEYQVCLCQSNMCNLATKDLSSFRTISIQFLCVYLLTISLIT